MDDSKCICYKYTLQGPGDAELATILDAVDATALIQRLQDYRRKAGRKGYPLTALWRAFLASYALNLPHTNALIRRLEDSETLRDLCGFEQLPHRTTFNRFNTRLADHQELVDAALRSLTAKLAEELPGFGEKVAIDSTVVRTHSNPHREPRSDPDASWAAKSAAGGRHKKEWRFGYKYHAIADATYGLPIVGFVTTGSRGDSPTLPVLMDQAKAEHDWFAPKYVMADKGYDSEANHRAVLKRRAVPIIAIRKTSKKGQTSLREGIYTDDCVPTCIGLVPMEYVRTDPTHGHLYQCRTEGCHLKDRKGVRYCQELHWENRFDRARLFGSVRRDSAKWKELYGHRQAVERLFKGMKESRRLEAHCLRGLKKVSLHASMSALTFQATALVRHKAGRTADLRWMVRKVA